MGGGTIPTPSAEPETTSERLVLEGGADEKLIFLLVTERTVTTSGGMLSAEEGATVLEKLVSETEGTGTKDLPSPFIINTDSPQSELQNLKLIFFLFN